LLRSSVATRHAASDPVGKQGDHFGQRGSSTHPCGILSVCFKKRTMLGADEPYMMTAVLFAAVPMLTIYPILGAAHEAEQVCATALIATTVRSFATVSGLIWLLGFLGQTI
jgi:hypothetical protein